MDGVDVGTTDKRLVASDAGTSGRRGVLGFGRGGGRDGREGGRDGRGEMRDVSTRDFGRGGGMYISEIVARWRGLGRGLSLRLGLGGAIIMELSSMTMQNTVM